MLADPINKDRKAFEAMMDRTKVGKLFAFGSSVHGPFRADSDVDVLVEVDADDEVAGRYLIDLWNGLEDLFQRPVDLLTEASMRNPYLRAEVERTKRSIMTEPSAKFWSDILTAIEEIEVFVADIASLNAYVKDLRTKRAVERGLAIIGKAIEGLNKLAPPFHVEGARMLPAHVMSLPHDHQGDAIVWEIVRTHLPALKQVLRQHLP